MTVHTEQRRVKWSPRQMFDLVADVDTYPEFLPWTLAARINRREGNVFWADMVIGFRMVREKFTSKVTLDAADLRIDVDYLDGPLKYLHNHWKFISDDHGGCIIDFYIDFEFKSRLLQNLIGVLFNEAIRRMVSAFENRAQQKYG